MITTAWQWLMSFTYIRPVFLCKLNPMKAHWGTGSWSFPFEGVATFPPQADHVLVDLFSSVADGGLCGQSSLTLHLWGCGPSNITIPIQGLNHQFGLHSCALTNLRELTRVEMCLYGPNITHQKQCGEESPNWLSMLLPARSSHGFRDTTTLLVPLGPCSLMLGCRKRMCFVIKRK